MLAHVARAEVFAGGLWQGTDDSGQVEVRLSEPGPAVLNVGNRADIADLASLLEVAYVSDGMCMCLGDTSFALFDSTETRLAIAALHHASTLRWAGWAGDAVLVDGHALVRWLASKGYVAPLDQQDRELTYRRAAEIAEADWLAHVPSCLGGMAGSFIECGQTGHLDALLLETAAATLDASLSHTDDRLRALLRWHSAGTGRSTGFPVYEDIPHRLLAAHSVNDVLATLAVLPMTSTREWRGAVRHLAGWKSRANWELQLIPPALWEALEAAAGDADPDTQERLSAKRQQRD